MRLPSTCTSAGADTWLPRAVNEIRCAQNDHRLSYLPLEPGVLVDRHQLALVDQRVVQLAAHAGRFGAGQAQMLGASFEISC